MSFTVNVPTPKNEQDFEELCGHVYGKVLKDPLPKNNGRRGQKQFGVDLFIQKDFKQNKENRIGIQCKAVKKLSFNGASGDSVCAEVKKAEAGDAQIAHLLITTTLPNDANLTSDVQKYSDERSQLGKFTVAIDFWEDISQKIRDDEILLSKYTSTSDAAKLLIEQARNYYQENEYSLVLRNLTDPSISLEYFSPKQQATRFRLLGLSHGYLGDVEQAKVFIEQAMSLEPYSEETFKARILVLMLEHESQKAALLNDEAKKIYPTENSFDVFELLLESDNEKDLPKFEDLDKDLRGEDNIVKLYLKHYMDNNDFDAFSKLYDSQSAENKATTVYSWLYLNSFHNQIVLKRDFSDERKNKLREIMQLFSPRPTKLWTIENKQILFTLVTVLASSHTLLGEVDEAYQILKDYEEMGNILQDRQLAIYFEATAQLKPDNLLSLINKNITSLNDTLIVHTYQLALNKQITSVVDKLDEVALTLQNQTLVDILKALRWEAEYASKPDETIALIESSEILSSIDVTALCITAGIIYKFNQTHVLIDEIIGRLKQLVGTENNEMDRRNLAALYSNIDLYNDAIPLLKGLIDTVGDTLSLKTKLIECYVQTSRFRDAKELLSSFPKYQLEDDALRFQALKLAQATHDWDYLTKLLVYEEGKFKNNARTWVLKLTLALRKSSESEIRKITREIPLDLVGHYGEIGYLARLEMKFGKQSKALNRVYQMVRKNFNDLQARTEYTNSIFGQIFNGYELSILDEEISTVQSGSTIYFTDNFGHSGYLSIDFENGFPELENFLSPNNELVSVLNGKRVGDTFTISSLGFTRTCTIDKIESIYLTLHRMIIDKVSDIGSGPQNFVSFKIDFDNGGVDSFLKVMSDDLEKRSLEVDRIFQQYREHHFTIGMLAHVLGKETYELLYNWPRSIEQSLIVSDGSTQDTESSRDVIVQNGSTLVVDGNTLIEIERNQMWEVFKGIETVYISSTTNEKINEWHFGAENSLSQQSGSFVYDDGLRLIDADPNQKKRVLSDLENIKKFINSEQCEVLPAYGESEDDLNKLRFYDMLSNDESASLRLAKEKSCPLLSSDSRLRQLAILDGIKAVQPNILYQHRYETSDMSERDYYLSIAKQFVSNRWLCEDYPPEAFAWYCAQGGQQARVLFHKIRALMLTIDNIENAIKVIVTNLVPSFFNVMRVTIAAYGEIISYIISGIKNNPKYNESIHKPILHEAIESISTSFVKNNTKSLLSVFGSSNALVEHEKLLQKNQYSRYLLGVIEEKLNSDFNPNTLPEVDVVFGKVPQLFKIEKASPIVTTSSNNPNTES
jgi:hypothetical protein